MDRRQLLIMKGKSFTLIELVIYIAIISSFLVLLTGLLWDVVLGNVKESSYQEVQQNARFSLAKISQEVRKAKSIISPLPGTSDDILSLEMTNPSFNPTIFDVSNGKLRISRGLTGPFELTTDQVIVSNLSFTNLSYPETPGTIRVEIMIEHANPSNLKDYQASINLKSTISLLEGGASF